MNEVGWQSKILKRIKKEGGWGKKWATSYTVGVPDLILSFEEKGVCVTEVKLEKDWNTNTKRTLKLTEKQLDNLNKIRDAGGLGFVTLVVDNGSREQWVSIYPAPKMGEKLEVQGHYATSNQTALNWKSKKRLIDFINREISHA